MSWDYRLCTWTEDGEEIYAIHEVYYGPDGAPRSFVQDPIIVGGSPEEVDNEIQLLKDGWSKPVLRLKNDLSGFASEVSA